MKRVYYTLSTFEYVWSLVPSLSVRYYDGSSGTGWKEINIDLEFLRWNLCITFVISEGYMYE